MASDDGFGTRMVAALRQLVTSSPDDSEEPGAVSLLDEAAERLRLSATLMRLVGSAGQDQIVRLGEPYEVSAALPRLRGPLGQVVRFSLDGQPLGEAPVTEGAVAHLTRRTERLGVSRVTWDALGPLQVQVVSPDPTRFTVIQVVDASPVVAVDASLVLAGDPDRLAGLFELAGAGMRLLYIDAGERRRTDAVRAAVEAVGLPVGAILSYPDSHADFGTFGVSFRRVFVTHAARHARASGVSFLALVTDDAERWAGCEEEDIALLTLGAVEAGMADGTLAQRLLERAADLEASWSTQDRLSLRLDRSTRTRAVAGNACHVELDNQLARQAVLSAIDAARGVVNLQLYILEDGRFTDRLGVALISAARRRVHVRLLVDALYSGHDILGMSNPVVDGLREEPGIEVRANDPIHRPSGLEAKALKERDHRKLIIVDSEWAVVGGRNAGDHYYLGFDEVSVADFTAHGRIPWLDAHMAVQGPLVAAVEESFATAWRRSGGEMPDPAPPGPPAGPSRARFVVHDGILDADGMAAYEALLDGAEQHVIIVNDFPIASPLVAAVRRALGRGIEVTLLTGSAVARRGDGSFFRGPLHREVFEYVTKRRLEPLIRSGMAVYEYATPPGLPLVVCRGGVVRPYVHAKLMTADGRAASVGSANLDATASYWEREANIIVEDEALVAQLEGQLLEMIGHSHRIDLDSAYWKKERVAREVATRLWPDSMYS